MQRTILHSAMVRQSTRILLSVLTGALLFAGWGWKRTHPHWPSTRELARLSAHTPPGMALVPGGYCLLGTDDSDADEDVKPLRRVFVPSFYMDRHEVTNSEYRKFDPAHHFDPEQGDLPVTGVTYDQAAAYAHWAGKRLPTEEEWEKAARGTDGRRYPWGNIWDPHRVAQRADPIGHATPTPAARTLRSNHFVGCNLGPPRVRPVGSVSDGISPYGCCDMAGNAWEWVQGFYNGNPNQRILRGGAVGYGERACRTYNRAIEGAGST